MNDKVAVQTSGEAEQAVSAHVPGLVEERFASRLFMRDSSLWGDDAQDEASKRLGWVGLASASRELLPALSDLQRHSEVEGLDRVVLCGMGGSSLAPEVICATAGADLVVLDSSHPDMVRAALTDLERTVVVVSSKSGSTVETDSQRRAFEQAFRDAGFDPAQRIVVVTDPGSPLQEQSEDAGYRVVNADPEVGGRYSALTAFGLVPSALAGVRTTSLLGEAAEVVEALSEDDPSNPGLVLGAAMAGLAGPDGAGRRDKLVLVDEGSGLVGFPAWAEQLIAESTGKLGTGVLPVVVEPAIEGGTDAGAAPEVHAPTADSTVVHLVRDASEARLHADGADVAVSGSLGGQMLLWEVATAVAGRLLGINPFDQPDVESAKKAARAMLDDPPSSEAGSGSGSVEVTALGGDGDWLGADGADGADLDAAVAALLGELDLEHGYVAVMAYLDRWEHASLEHDLRRALAHRTHRPVTFGWGPRFLHSTGQYHKGGPAQGVYLQVTDTPREDLAVPGRDFGFATLIAAQAAGDAQVLAEHGRPVLRVHLHDVQAGLAALRRAAEGRAS